MYALPTPRSLVLLALLRPLTGFPCYPAPHNLPSLLTPFPPATSLSHFFIAHFHLILHQQIPTLGPRAQSTPTPIHSATSCCCCRRRLTAPRSRTTADAGTSCRPSRGADPGARPGTLLRVRGPRRPWGRTVAAAVGSALRGSALRPGPSPRLVGGRD
jgi:hypothetical protein